jgi:hypothetical protein
MWAKENRGRYDRSRLRYPSDLTDEQWALVEPLIAPQWPDVCAEHRLPVASDPEGPAAAQHGARLF